MNAVANINRKVLVLNKHCIPIRFVGIDRAVALLCGVLADGRPKAKVLDVSLENFEKLTWEDWADLRPEKEVPLRVLRAMSLVTGLDVDFIKEMGDHTLKLSELEIVGNILNELVAKLVKTFNFAKINPEVVNGWETVGDVQQF